MFEYTNAFVDYRQCATWTEVEDFAHAYRFPYPIKPVGGASGSGHNPVSASWPVLRPMFPGRARRGQGRGYGIAGVAWQTTSGRGP